MIYQHIKSDINDTKCMLQNRQNNTASPPAAPSQVSDDDDGLSRRQEFCTGKGVPREPCAQPETQLAGQTCNLLCLSVFASPPTAEWQVLTWRSFAYCLPLPPSCGRRDPFRGVD